MSQFARMLRATQHEDRPMVLIASLPRNDVALARAALDAGADVVKVHLNVEHHASGMHFGSLAEERDALQQIRAAAGDVPCGLVPGATPALDSAELEAVIELGFDFISLYLRHAPAGVLPARSRLGRMFAPAFGDAIEQIGALDQLGVDVCELSIMDPDTYGEPLTFHDLARYAALRRVSTLPFVVPTQHYIPPAAVADLRAAGVQGIMIGAIVAGKTAASWQETTAAFRHAIDTEWS